MSNTLPSPNLLRRLMAMFYDLFLVVPIIAAALTVALAIQVKALDSASHELQPIVTRILIIVSAYSFFMLFWLKQGQTLGMQAWRIKLVSNNGEKPGFAQTLVRCIGATFSAACLGLGYLWCLVDARGRSWHDILSRTELVLLPKRNAKTADPQPAKSDA